MLEKLFSHAVDAEDHNLPLMYWYGLESVMDADPSRALQLAASTKIPNILNFAVRRQAMKGGQQELDQVVALLAKVEADQQRADILTGMTLGLKGRRGVAAPAGWDELASKLANGPLAQQVQNLSVVFGSQAAMATLAQTALDPNADKAARLSAIEALQAARDPNLPATLQKLLADPAVRAAALRGLASINDEKTPAAILSQYASFSPTEKKDALTTLAGRPAYAEALVAALDKQVPKADFTADILRQLRNAKSDKVAEAIKQHWALNETAEDKLERIRRIRKLVSDGVGGRPSLANGRRVFNTVCASCHVLYGEGGHVGPDITGSDRANLDYLLLNVVDPNAVIPADYQAWMLDTTDDRNIIGLLRKQDDQSVTIQTATETLTLPRSDIAKLRVIQSSMMPEGLLDALPQPDMLDLIAYLQSKEQSYPLADENTAKLLFNGKDLSGWDMQVDDLWKVENGEIVGKTETGIKKNQFLTSKAIVRDFRIVVKMKLTPDAANSGIQFRSIRLPNSHEMRGCQADAGKGWWGKLYEESGRKLLFPKPGQAFDSTPFVKAGDWNTYEILAVGGKIKTAINGHLCTDLDDPEVAKEGLLGLQVHSGGPTEVRWKDFELEVNPKFELKTVK